MVTDFTEGARNAFRAALALAERDQAECLHVIAIRSPFDRARGASAGKGGAMADRETLLDEFAEIAADSPVPIKPRVINSATGVSAANFISSVEADLAGARANCGQPRTDSVASTDGLGFPSYLLRPLGGEKAYIPRILSLHGGPYSG